MQRHHVIERSKEKTELGTKPGWSVYEHFIHRTWPFEVFPRPIDWPFFAYYLSLIMRCLGCQLLRLQFLWWSRNGNVSAWEMYWTCALLIRYKIISQESFWQFSLPLFMDDFLTKTSSSPSGSELIICYVHSLSSDKCNPADQIVYIRIISYVSWRVFIFQCFVLSF